MFIHKYRYLVFTYCEKKSYDMETNITNNQLKRKKMFFKKDNMQQPIVYVQRLSRSYKTYRPHNADHEIFFFVRLNKPEGKALIQHEHQCLMAKRGGAEWYHEFFPVEMASFMFLSQHRDTKAMLFLFYKPTSVVRQKKHTMLLI